MVALCTHTHTRTLTCTHTHAHSHTHTHTHTHLVQKLEVCLGTRTVAPVGILILHLEPYYWPSVGTLERYQYTKQPLQVLRHGLGVGRVVGAQLHVRIMEKPPAHVYTVIEA